MNPGASTIVLRFGDLPQGESGDDDLLAAPLAALESGVEQVIIGRCGPVGKPTAVKEAAEATALVMPRLKATANPRVVVVGAGHGVLPALCAAQRLIRYAPRVALLGDASGADPGKTRHALRWIAARPPARSCLLRSPDLWLPDTVADFLADDGRYRATVLPEWASPDTAARGVMEWLAFVPGVREGYPLLDTGGRSRPGWAADPGSTITWALAGHSRATIDAAIHDVVGHTVDRVTLRLQPHVIAGDEPWRTGAGLPAAGKWPIPPDQRSGVYLLDGRPDLFVAVRDPARTSPIALLLSTNTFNAYSNTHDRSVYDHPIRAPEVAFDRPMNQVKAREWQALFQWMWTHPRWARDHRVLIDADMDDEDMLTGVKVLIVVGHSEYWTRRAREVFDNFVARGGHAIVAGGNTLWWQVRYGDDGRTMICHKYPGEDPTPGPSETVNWASDRLGLPVLASTGGDFRHGGFGHLRRPTALSRSGYTIAEPASPLLRGLDRQRGDWVDLGAVREYDGMPIAGFDVDGYPVPDHDALGTGDAEIVAHAWGQRGGEHTLGTLHAFTPRPGGGTVVHLGFKEAGGLAPGGDRDFVTGVLDNAVAAFMEDRTVFSGRPPRAVARPFHTPAKHVPADWPNPAHTNPDGVHDLRRR